MVCLMVDDLYCFTVHIVLLPACTNQSKTTALLQHRRKTSHNVSYHLTLCMYLSVCNVREICLKSESEVGGSHLDFCTSLCESCWVFFLCNIQHRTWRGVTCGPHGCFSAGAPFFRMFTNKLMYQNISR